MHGRPAHRHPARRQEKRDTILLDNIESLANVVERNAADGIATVYSVVYVTASATFKGPTAGFVTQGLPTSSGAGAAKSGQNNNSGTNGPAASRTGGAASSGASSRASGAESTASVKATATVSPSASGSQSQTASTAVTASATSSILPTSTVASSSVVLQPSSISSTPSAALAKATVSSPAKASATASPSSPGLSSGAKGGVAFAVLLGLGLIAALIFFFIRRKKERQQGAQRLEDLENEKRMRSPTPPRPVQLAPVPPPAPVPEPALSIRSSSPAPRLSIRPTSRFSLGADPEKAAAGIAAAGATIEPKQSPWEKRSHSDPANPFGIHAETVNNAPTQMAQASESTVSFELQGSPVPYNPRLSATPVGAAAALAEPRPATSPIAPSTISPTKAEFGTASAVPVISAAGAVSKTGTGAQPLGNNVHRVQLEFMPTRDDEIELKPGAIVRLLHEYDDGWALCMTMDRSKQGVAPRTCMSKLPLKPRPTGPPQGRPISPMGPPPMNQQKMRKASAPMPRPNPHNSMMPAPLSPAMNASPRQRTASGPQQHPRSMSPGPKASSAMAESRRRSASVGSGNSPTKATSPVGPSPLNPLAMSAVPTRKPVPGQAM